MPLILISMLSCLATDRFGEHIFAELVSIEFDWSKQLRIDCLRRKEGLVQQNTSFSLRPFFLLSFSQ